MKFRVLGPLQVSDADDRHIQFSPKQRDLLAVLLCQPRTVVSASQIVESLWGETSPPSALRTVRAYVHRLRRGLGDATRIVHQNPGYLVAVNPGELDTCEFADLVRRGQHARADDRPGDAADLLRTALACWRGPAFAGQGGLPLVREESVRLNEMRLCVTEERIEADLALGRHAELVGELRAIVADNPFRERFSAQLMLALYRSGRPADALEAYRDVRATLADELGLDPGQELRALERSVLAQDPSLNAPPTQAAAVIRRRPMPAPAGLPPRIRTFTGRRSELDRLHATLTDAGPTHTRIAAIDGAGGTGTSALAIHAAHQVAEHFPDGQLYADLHGATPGVTPLTPIAVLCRFMRAMGAEEADIPVDTEEAAARFRTLTAGRRMLVVLDDAVDARQVRHLLPGGSGSAVLVTSRRVLSTLDGAAHIHLGELPEAESVELLASLAGRQRVAAEPEAAARIVRWCGRLPLAVRIAGARLTARPDLSLTSFSTRLADTRARLDELQYDDLTVRASFAAGISGLGDDAAGRNATRLFGLIGRLGLPHITLPACAALLDEQAGPAGYALDRLLDARLVELSASSRYQMHDLIRDYAREYAAAHVSTSDQDAALCRVARWYLAASRTAAILFDPGSHFRTTFGQDTPPGGHPGLELTTLRAAQDWLKAESGNLIEAMRMSEECAPSMAIGLATTLFQTYERRERLHQGVAIARIGLRAAERIGDVRGMAQTSTDLGRAYVRLGYPDDAAVRLGKALAGWREAGDRTGEALALGNLAAAYCARKQYDQALATAELGLRIHRETGDLSGEALILCCIGRIHGLRDHFDEAIFWIRQSIALANQDGGCWVRGFGLGLLAAVYRRAGRLDEAVACFEGAIEAVRMTGDRYDEADLRWFLSRALQEQDRHDDAMRQRRESRVLAQDRDVAAPGDIRALLSPERIA